jgi:hypothetical protein
MSLRAKSTRQGGATTAAAPGPAQRLLAWSRSLAGRLVRSCAGAADPSAQTPRPVLESLEPRLLLSTSPLSLPAFTSTMSYTALPLGALDVTLELIDTGAPNLNLQLRSGSTVLASQALDQNTRVAFTGSVFNDRLTVNLNYDDHGSNAAHAPWAIQIAFDGGTDTPLTDDQLVFTPAGPKAWRSLPSSLPVSTPTVRRRHPGPITPRRGSDDLSIRRTRCGPNRHRHQPRLSLGPGRSRLGHFTRRGGQFGKVTRHLMPAGTSPLGFGSSRRTPNVPLAESTTRSTTDTVAW